MSGFFKRLFGDRQDRKSVAATASSTAPLAEGPTTPAGPSDRKVWQRQWHEILDGYSDHPDETQGDKGVPDPLPDMHSDFRLQSNFWFADWKSGMEARERAFTLLPRGDQLLERVETYLSEPRRAIDPDEAGAILKQGLLNARKHGFETVDPETPIRILREEDQSLLEAFSKADNPFLSLRDALPHMAKKESGDAGWEAYFFLSKPFYRLGGNSYDRSNWFIWPLCTPGGLDDLTEANMRLCEGGWSAGCGDEGLFLYDRRKEFGLVL